MRTHTLQFCEDKLAHRGFSTVHSTTGANRQLIPCILWCLFHEQVTSVSNNNLMLTSRPNAGSVSTRNNPFIFSSKNWRKFIHHVIRDNLSLSETTGPPPFRLLSKHYTFSSDFSKPLGSTLFCAYSSYLVTCSWTPANNIFSSIFLPLVCPFQPHYMNCLQVSLSQAPMEVSKQSQ